MGHRVTNRDLNRDRPSMRCCSIEDPVSENPVDPSSAGRTRSFCEAELGDAEALHRRAPVAPARRPRGVARGQGADPAILVGFILSPHTFTSISRSFGRVGLRRWIKAPISQGAWVRIPPSSIFSFCLFPFRPPFFRFCYLSPFCPFPAGLSPIPAAFLLAFQNFTLLERAFFEAVSRPEARRRRASSPHTPFAFQVRAGP